ncbi:hypothetical protein GmRootV118_03020 [Variovorax sp. V118]|uniref:3-hydroxyacyl-CoA dehydrogenase NAD-binding domain-containing protein n=1 Tax=Variovorax sp. V118 TaxID=3065954 RepID=UPI0034E89590
MLVVILGEGIVASQLAGLFASHGARTFLVRTSGELGGSSACAIPNVGLFTSLEEASNAIRAAAWIIEASELDLDRRRGLLRRLEDLLLEGALVTVDESILPLSILAEGMSSRLLRRFAIAHFFVPVDRLPLVEIVPSALMPDERTNLLVRNLRALGRTPMSCRDLPGFIANRIGFYLLALATREAIERKIPFDLVDATAHSSWGLPRSGVFGLIDLIGVETTVRLMSTLADLLPNDLALQAVMPRGHTLFEFLAQGVGPRSFYRPRTETRPKQVWRAGQQQYVDIKVRTDDVKNGAREEEIASFSKFVSERVATYVRLICEEHAISEDVAWEAMRLGYGWSKKAMRVPSGKKLVWIAA